MLLRATAWALALSTTALANSARVIRCEAINLALKAAIAANDTSPTVKPSVALECLASVPLDVERDIALMEFLLPYLSFQSTVGYLKKPPKGYLLPPVDIIGGALAIREKVRGRGYKNQYEFVLDIQRMLAATGDGHVSYTPALFGLFSFDRTLNITSVSSDGLELPKIYDVNDILSPGESVSDIQAIDDKPIQEYLAHVASLVTSQDPDAQFNYLFWSIPGQSDVFTSSSWPLPDSHTITFANGSTRVYENKVSIPAAFADISTGEELHEAIEIPPPVSPEQQAEALKIRRRDGEPTEEAPPAETKVPLYPDAVLVQRSGYMSGYFLNESTHPDTAVLVATAFIPTNETVLEPSAIPEYRATRKFLSEFFALCTKNGRTKLIIDLSANGGGLLMQGYELYRNLFPDAKAYSGSRYRAHAAINIMGAAVYNTPDDEKAVLSGFYLNPSTSKRYPDWSSFYGPVSFPEDRETNLFVYDFSDPKNDVDPTTNTPFFIAGFDPEYKPTQPFKAGDITILTDGKCGSTCTIFTALMVHEQKVRTIALGGRPLSAPMQAVGGVKGSLVQTFKDIQALWNAVITQYKPSIPSNLLPGLPTNGTPPLMPIDLSKQQVNYRNAHLEKDPNGPPTHFLYEAANCRRFYKASYLTDITTLWNDIADVAWKGAKCVSGSTPNSDSKISNSVVEWSDNLKVFSQVSIYDGPGSQTNQEWLALAAKNVSGTAEGLSNGVGRVGTGGLMGLSVAAVVAIFGLL
ncbi:hypothetical protein B0T16DRAFT_503206 [Cercophora newfieldiana]|uniref:Tail specific protease domain-containing protein n=1 Tax=Cercophora newfieldiana TaxID=92897 RepID=A0AA40CVU8_9PEZI|nr:hypothetical protein B0T16DRAFT_503206 [Cercophora newfieldiana]